MRRSLFRLASVKPARYLEPGTRTGLTGLLTHSSPRATLLYLYTSTLDKLKAVPEHSLYRQSVEAVTKHRLSIVEKVVPPGYDEWAARAQKLVADNPEQFNIVSSEKADGASASRVESGGHVFVVRQVLRHVDMRDQEWDGELDPGSGLDPTHEGLTKDTKDLNDATQITWETEPQLTADQ